MLFNLIRIIKSIKTTVLKTALISLAALIGANANAGEPPPLQILAGISTEVYDPLATSVGDYVPFKNVGNDDANYGLRAVAYRSGDQIVIGVRGTDPANNPNFLYNMLTNSTFSTGVRNVALSNTIAQLSQFVASVAAENPGVQISMTGHSLGGAYAQIIGEAAGIPVTSFNAPGAAAAVPAIKEELSALSAIQLQQNAPPKTTNYRTYGDQISTIGTQLGRTITLSNLRPNAEVDQSLYSTWNASHKMTLMIDRINNLCLANGDVSCRGPALDSWCDMSVCADSAYGAMIKRSLAGYGADGWKLMATECGEPKVNTNTLVSSSPGMIASCTFTYSGNKNFAGATIKDFQSAFIKVDPSATKSLVTATGGIDGKSIVPAIIALSGAPYIPREIQNLDDVSSDFRNFFASAVLGAKNLFAGSYIAAAALGVAQIIDPPPGDFYVLKANAGTPTITSIDLPIFEEINGWALKYHSSEGWSLVEEKMGNGNFQFDSGIDMLSFLPLDNFSNPLYNPYPFLMQMGFGKEGLADITIGTYEFGTLPSNVSEPSTITLMGLALVAFVLNRRKYVKRSC